MIWPRMGVLSLYRVTASMRLKIYILDAKQNQSTAAFVPNKYTKNIQKNDKYTVDRDFVMSVNISLITTNIQSY